MARKHYSDIRRELYRDREAKRREISIRRRSGQNRKAETNYRFSV